VRTASGIPTVTPGSSHAEIYFYKQATERLIQAGFDVLRVDCNQQAAQHVAAHILQRLTAFFAPPTEQE
jgi:dTMP kinase